MRRCLSGDGETIRKSTFTDEQMVKILREADAAPVSEVAKKYWGSEQALYVWRKRFGTMTAPDAKRLKVLEAENGRVIEVLAKLMTVHGAPKYLRSDNGPEFVSAAILRWLSEASVETAHIDPGRPWQNGTDESFNGKFRDECLSMEWFRSRSEAAAIIEIWRRHYNEVRPHSSLGYLTPHAFTQQHEQSEATHGGEAVL